MEWVLNIKDIIIIVTLASSILGAYYSSRKDIEQLRLKQKDMEKTLLKLESDINKELEEIKSLQKDHGEKVLEKFDKINQDMSETNRQIAELTGFLKGRDIK